ncbi:MAG: hypothetical protein HXS53_11335 [Theionarchaea archaeon]|nr:hypothetical protein [Theionarchaea archaeon]MBU7033118.1 hypothetical protein [Theionarchaea archaeon]
MKKCPYCNTLNSEKAIFCWKCYKRLYALDIDGYFSLRKRIKQKVRNILQYSDIRELLREKTRLMSDPENEEFS